MKIKSLLLIALAIVAFSSCTTVKHTMREPNVRVDLTKADFTLSQQVSGEASSTKILCIDWARLLNKKMGAVDSDTKSFSIASIPVIGDYLADKTANYALWEIMQQNTGYDVVFYPQYEVTKKKPVIGLGFIMTKTEVKATARLGKLK